MLRSGVVRTRLYVTYFLTRVTSRAASMWVPQQTTPSSELNDISLRPTLGSIVNSLQSRLVEQKTIVRLFPPAAYTLITSLMVLVRLRPSYGEVGTSTRATAVTARYRAVYRRQEFGDRLACC